MYRRGNKLLKPKFLHYDITTDYSLHEKISPQELIYKTFKENVRCHISWAFSPYPLQTTHAGSLWALTIAWFLTTSLWQSAGIKGGCGKHYISWFLVSALNGWVRLTQCPGNTNPVKTTNHWPTVSIPSFVKRPRQQFAASSPAFLLTPNVWYEVGLGLLWNIIYTGTFLLDLW